MPFDYQKMADTAERLLGATGFGVTQTLQRVTAGVFDPATGTTAGKVVTEITTAGLEKAVTTEMISGGSVEIGDKLFILTPAELPLMTDKFKVGAEFWQIVNVSSKNPTGIAISHEIQVRK